MNLSRAIWRSVFVLAGTGMLIGGCDRPYNSNTDTPMVPNESTTTPAMTRPTQPPPLFPIRMEKPRLLGPVSPGIVALPRNTRGQMSEPQVRIRLTTEQATPPVINSGKYRGRIDTYRLANGKYIAINIVPMDTYLTGVLAKELYGSWSNETYRAQAIAARTYALYQILTQGSDKLWDVNADESSQMYGGIAGETAKASEAVSATRGQVLTATANNQTGVFCAFYSACSGGATQDPAEAWGDSTVSPLSARPLGAVDRIAKFEWPPMSVSKTDISRCINNWGQRNSFMHLQNLGPIVSVVISKRNPATQRPTELLLTDMRGQKAPIRAEEFRLALKYDPAGSAPKPPSSYFEIQEAGSFITLTNGHGYGHGIGMSQWGAQNLAQQGRNHQQILSFFYPGSQITRAW